ncbi:DNA damage-binding protein 1-like [Paramacrobiotus metropolitanus]|uniref:DNA damage-binding protein 1-like n=1 Tax=Paramacrobiotus metropolitanus TaxID=2943436 RepID=UPI00244644C8|nr:DNA damage-binding protein 1-like [Paramacrobiotus metropolitanus]XP_055340575.1 DNA damage-binding protein 1-like [Paramacrobiotus metropolitanus]XP_055340583.1 DNA damage-binding protein 1-like [Paramacrobiotus metropolitanus]XP_055340591.1 DNA damage-binding protein 1-like [Paramacrobiotus metropolitanus]XP_055340599.1 DNA damage-binding protein 1-like [Paramacrobiotus metropolitanus]XP_055340607.1 DNA damage-binding protein 1-like [Paramacrobiotus metropolitanus]XP_055340615.1 DNA dama
MAVQPSPPQGCYYVATAYQSNVVKYAASGHFTTKDHLELLTVRTNYLELSRVDGDDLQDVRQLNFSAAVSGLWAFRPEADSHHAVLILTRRHHLIMLQFENSSSGIKIVERGAGKFPSNADLILLESGPLAAFHYHPRTTICLALFRQRLEIIQFTSALKFETFPIRVDTHDIGGIVGLGFLQPNENNYSLAILQTTIRMHEGLPLQGPLLTFSSLNMKTREKEKVESSFTKLDFEADLMLVVDLPTEAPGVLVVGNGAVQYFNTKEYASAVSPFLTRAGVISSCELYRDTVRMVVTYLLGYSDGRLVLVIYRHCPHNMEERIRLKLPPCKLNVELLGVAAVAQTLSVIGDGLVFLGSCAGPGSLILRIRENINTETKNYFDVISTFPALGSVLELEVMKHSQKQGLDECSLLACTADTFGNSLTIIRSGIKLEDPMEIPLCGMVNVWCVKFPALNSEDVFVFSTLTDTRCAILQSEDLCELDVPVDGAFTTNSRTLLCDALIDYNEPSILQVTPISVVLIKREINTVISELKFHEEVISKAKLCDQVLVICRGRKIEVISFADKAHPQCTKIYECGNEICGLEVFPGPTGSLFCAVGEWQSFNVSVLKVADGEVIESNLVPDARSLPRSLTFCNFGPASFLFCGFGDGSVTYFRFDTATLRMFDPKRVAMGTRPFAFVRFPVHDSQNVFVCSDRPCVISFRNGRLSFANVNIPNVVDICSLEGLDNAALDPESLMIVTNESLLVGQLEDIQKLHLIPLPLGFQAFQFAYQADSHMFGVIGDRKDCRVNRFSSAKPTYEEEEERVLYILDRNSFEVVTSYRNDDREEYICCICSWNPEETSYFIMGTEKKVEAANDVGFVLRGSVFVLQLINSRLQVILSYSCNQPVHFVSPYGKYLLAAGETELYLYEWLGHQIDLCHRFETGGAMISSLDVLGNTILIGDMHKSVILLQYNKDQGLSVTGREQSSYFLQNAALIDETTAIVSDDWGNLAAMKFTGKKLKSALLEEDNCQIMDMIAGINMCDLVTTIQRGMLIPEDSVGECSIKIRNSLVFGTSKGQLGVVFELDSELFSLLAYIESQMMKQKRDRALNAADAAEAMKFYNGLMEADHFGFVNGDLVETFLHLRPDEMSKILKGFKGPVKDGKVQRYSVADVTKFLDDLVRLH